jgi:hypothetical protein
LYLSDSELHIKPVASYLQGLGATREQIRRMILTYPAGLGHSVDEHLRPLVEYLTDVGVKIDLMGGHVSLLPTTVVGCCHCPNEQAFIARLKGR